MFNVLNNYLFQHKSISVPGLGTIYLETLPAESDASGKNILPPAYHFRFDKYFDAPDKDFFLHIAAEKNIPDYEAIKWYNEFSYELRNKIRHEEKAEWEGVGVLKKDDEGNIVFESTAGTPSFLQPVAADLVNHKEPALAPSAKENENNFSATEMAYPEDIVVKKNKWWVYALVAAVVAIIILLFHFASNGWQQQSTGNQQTLEIAK